MKSGSKQAAAFLVSLIVSHAASALTLIESKQSDGSTEKIYIDKLRVRIDTSGEPSYLLLDGSKKTILAISPEEQKIIDMSHGIGSEPREAIPNYKVEFIDKGKGPDIAGYPTRHYLIRVEGQTCSDEYTSTKMLESLGIKETFKKVFTMFRQLDMESMPGMDVCTKADEQVSDLYAKYGFPLRSFDASGVLESEVIRIDKNAAMPQGGMTAPTTYQRVSMEEMMQGVQDMQDMMDMSPEELQNMSPEQQKQLQQMMEGMMQQMQQQKE